MIKSYTDLLDSVPKWAMKSTDQVFIAEVPNFIGLVETDLNNNVDFRPRFLEQRWTLPISAGTEFIGNPPNMDAPRNIKLLSDPVRTLQYMDPETLLRRYPTSLQDRPQAYTMLGDDVRLRPIADGDYTVEWTYWAKLAEKGETDPTDDSYALTADNPTNYISTHAGDIYLYGCLALGHMFLEDMERSRFWAPYYTRSVAQFIRNDRRRYYPSGMTSLADGATP